MNHSIRRGVPGDTQLLAELGAQTFAEAFAHLYSPENLQLFFDKHHSAAAYKRALADPFTAIWIGADDAGKPVGYSAARPCELPVDPMPDSAGELSRLYVLEEARGTGLGVELLERALSFLDQHFQWHYLSVYAHNPGAQRLYQRFGFRKIADYHYWVGNHRDPEFLYARERADR